MTKKIKGLIWILTIAILVVFLTLSGRWFWENQKIIKSTKTVAISTDKTEYEQNEIMKINLTNNFTRSIYYFYFGFQKLENNQWTDLHLHLPNIVEEGYYLGEQKCFIPLLNSRSERKPPLLAEQMSILGRLLNDMNILDEIKPYSIKAYLWSLTYCEKVDLDGGPPVYLAPGTYRLTFTYGIGRFSYVIGNKITIYSNKFTVE